MADIATRGTGSGRSRPAQAGERTGVARFRAPAVAHDPAADHRGRHPRLRSAALCVPHSFGDRGRALSRRGRRQLSAGARGDVDRDSRGLRHRLNLRHPARHRPGPGAVARPDRLSLRRRPSDRAQGRDRAADDRLVRVRNLVEDIHRRADLPVSEPDQHHRRAARGGFRPDRADHGDVRHAAQLLRYVQLPNALPYIMAGLNTGIVLAVIGAIVGEFVAPRPALAC